MDAMSEHANQPHKRLLIVADVTCTGDELFDEIHKHASEADTEVLIVMPALISRLHWWMSDGDAGDVAAQERLTISLERLRAAGVPARGAFGDANPLQAIDDAMRVFHPDDIIIATNPPERSNWLERDVVTHSRKRFDIPITHVVVDSTTDTAHVVPPESSS